MIVCVSRNDQETVNFATNISIICSVCRGEVGVILGARLDLRGQSSIERPIIPQPDVGTSPDHMRSRPRSAVAGRYCMPGLETAGASHHEFSETARGQARQRSRTTLASRQSSSSSGRQRCLKRSLLGQPSWSQLKRSVMPQVTKAYNGGFVEKHIEVLFGVGCYDCVSYLQSGSSLTSLTSSSVARIFKPRSATSERKTPVDSLIEFGICDQVALNAKPVNRCTSFDLSFSRKTRIASPEGPGSDSRRYNRYSINLAFGSASPGGVKAIRWVKSMPPLLYGAQLRRLSGMPSSGAIASFTTSHSMTRPRKCSMSSRACLRTSFSPSSPLIMSFRPRGWILMPDGCMAP